MEQIPIGTSGLNPSRIGLRTRVIGGRMCGGTDEARSIATIRSAAEWGVALIDIAPVHGFGCSEEVVGKVLAEGGLRDSKVGLAGWEGRMFRDFRPARIGKEPEDLWRRPRSDVSGRQP